MLSNGDNFRVYFHSVWRRYEYNVTRWIWNTVCKLYLAASHVIPQWNGWNISLLRQTLLLLMCVSLSKNIQQRPFFPLFRFRLLLASIHRHVYILKARVSTTFRQRVSARPQTSRQLKHFTICDEEHGRNVGKNTHINVLSGECTWNENINGECRKKYLAPMLLSPHISHDNDQRVAVRWYSGTSNALSTPSISVLCVLYIQAHFHFKMNANVWMAFRARFVISLLFTRLSFPSFYPWY